MIKRTGVGLPEELIKTFNKLCKARKRQRSEVIETLIRAYITNADENGWVEFIETKCDACGKLFQQPRIRAKRWCSCECHLICAVLKIYEDYS